MKSLIIKPNLEAQENRKIRRVFTLRLAARLREIRKSKKMTQQELAEAASLHLTYIGHLELGKYHPTVYVIWKIAKALNVSLDELAGN